MKFYLTHFLVYLTKKNLWVKMTYDLTHFLVY